jgi:hypothetical protein
MIRTTYTFELKGLMAGLTDRQVMGALNWAKKRAAAEAMEPFRKREIPGRFDNSKAGDLRWERRDASYTQDKRKKKGHGYDMKWSGRTEGRARAGKAFSTRKRFGLKVTGLGRQFRHRRRGQPNKKAELARVSTAEARKYGELFVVALVRLTRERLKATRKRLKLD